MNNLNKMIKDYRKANGLSSTEMSEKLNISISTLSKIESGERQVDGNTMFIFLTELNQQATVAVNPPINAPLNKEANLNNASSLLKLINEIMTNLEPLKGLPFKDNPLKKMVVDELPKLVHSTFSLDHDLYKITGSIGKGQFAEVPWLCVFLKDITKTATKGYYIVLLFSADGSSCYMSLNQGWTFYQEKYGTKEARHKIQLAAHQLAEELSGSDKEWILGPLDLKGRGILAKGYEIGNIYAKKYEVNQLPTVEQFVADFEKLLSHYHEINVLRGKRTVDNFTETLLLKEDLEFFEEEDEFDTSVQDVVAETIQDEFQLDEETPNPQPAREPIYEKNGKPKYTRRAIVAANALKKARFKCEIDDSHITFTNKVTGKMYMEAHHLIHMSKQNLFEYELDTIENIVSLCPNCHRLIHHGTDDEKEILINKLHGLRADALSNAKIYLPLPELKKMYGINY